MLIATYACFVLLQLALLNIILFGVMLIYLKKFFFFLHGLEHKANLKFKHRALHRFIENENTRYYRAQNVELVADADEEGRLIELQLPDDVDELRRKQRANKQ